jgi:tetratricopeptide (TPR) repeat protein
VKDVLRLLESELVMERQFAADAKAETPHPTGWPAALLLVHVATWREQLLIGLSQAEDGGEPQPPGNVDEFNAVELTRGAGVQLADAVARSEERLAELIDRWKTMGDRPFHWYVARTTGEALVRNSYSHPRNHIAEHFIELGNPDRGHQLYEETAAELRKAGAPGHTLGAAIYNLACARVAEGRHHDALRLLEEAIRLRDDLRTTAAGDPDLEPLRDNPQFQAVVQPAR